MQFAARSTFIAAAMLAAAAMAVALWPHERITDLAAKVDLEHVVPLAFGAWKLDPTLQPIQANPGVQTTLDKTYDQTLARTYVNGAGERVMLSIAYGMDQRGSATQVHQPESCYTGQGFQIVRSASDRLETGYGLLPVKRLFAVQGQRNEPITYWLTVGDRATLPGLDRKLAQLRYGLTGRIADGMLVRLSTIGNDAAHAYSVQDGFARDLLAAIREQDRLRFTGALGA
jgi:EpsI family protein